MNAIRLKKLTFRLLVILLLPMVSHAQVDDFNDNNDTGWSRFAPLSTFGGTTFATAGGNYELACNPSPDPVSFGPARCGSLRMDQAYTTFWVAVDIVNWNPAEDTSMGILARIQPGAAAGNVNGYAFTYQGSDQDVEINRITGEVPTNLGGSPDVTLIPGGSYRMVFFGVGAYVEGLIYNLADLSVPLVRTFAVDSTYASGHCGLVVFADANTRASAAFDNYRAGNGELPAPAVSHAGGALTVSWNAAAALGYSLEASDDLMQWLPAAGASLVNEDMNYQELAVPEEKPARFFRLRLGLPPFP